MRVPVTLTNGAKENQNQYAAILVSPLVGITGRLRSPEPLRAHGGAVFVCSSQSASMRALAIAQRLEALV
jgi:hypothetical protein